MNTVGIKTCPHSKVLVPSSLPPIEHNKAESLNFNYDPCSNIGPDAWAALSIDCIGYNQSPINIDYSKVCRIEPHASEGLKLFRWDQVPQKILLLNVGVTVKLFFEFKFNAVPTLCSGPVNDIYELSHLHLHWGGNSYEGSEHFLDGKSSSAEAHAVFKNRKYKTDEKASEHRDGFCVVARLYDYVCNQKQYLPFISKLKRITKFSQSYIIKEPYTFTLSCIMGSVGFEYFVYKGSLTIPPCSEAITWIIIKKTKKISFADLEELRKLRNSKNEWMTPNFRRIQPLNNRCISHYIR